jgi:hypothetical protein
MTLRTAPAPHYRKRQTNFSDLGQLQSMSENRREFWNSIGGWVCTRVRITRLSLQSSNRNYSFDLRTGYWTDNSSTVDYRNEIRRQICRCCGQLRMKSIHLRDFTDAWEVES